MFWDVEIGPEMTDTLRFKVSHWDDYDPRKFQPVVVNSLKFDYILGRQMIELDREEATKMQRLGSENLLSVLDQHGHLMVVASDESFECQRCGGRVYPNIPFMSNVLQEACNPKE